jgi:hypothetical protein
MPTISDLTRVSDNLQLSYQKDHVDNFFSGEVDTFLAHCEALKESDNGGAGFVVQVVSRGGVNSNPTYSLAGTGAPLRSKFTVQPVNIEWKATWTRDAMLAAESKGTAAMFDLAKEEIDLAQQVAKTDLGKMLGGKGWGSLAGIVAISGADVTIGHPDGNAAGAAVPALTNRFYEGQLLNSSDDEAAGDLRGTTPGTAYTVLSINRTTGVLTMTAAPTDFVDGDYLVEKGFRPFSASSGKKTVSGLEAWLDTSLAATTLGGTTPSLHPLGFVVTSDASLTNSTIAQQLIAADEFAFLHGLPQDGVMIFCSPAEHRSMCDNAVVGQVVNQNVDRIKADGSTYTISYKAFQLSGMRGIVPVVPSAFIRPGTAFWGPFKSKKMGFKLAYAGKLIMNINTGSDGLTFRMDPAGVTDNSGVLQAGYRAEGFFRGNLLCKHPGNYLVISGLGDTAV